MNRKGLTEWEKTVEELGLEFRLSPQERKEIEDQRKLIQENPEHFQGLEANPLNSFLEEKMANRWK